MSKQKSISKRTAIRHVFQRLMFGEDGTAGSVLVEATIIAPILVVMSIYAMDFGLVFYNKIEMQNAAQAGAQWAIANRVYNSSLIQVAAQNATKLPTSQITVSSSEFCGCSQDSSGNVVMSQLSSTACTVAPNSTCNTSGSTSGVAGNYVAVTASPTTTYHLFFPYGLISSTPNISATTTVRIQ
jgi:Flp pilus assembly protein TadG